MFIDILGVLVQISLNQIQFPPIAPNKHSNHDVPHSGAISLQLPLSPSPHQLMGFPRVSASSTYYFLTKILQMSLPLPLLTLFCKRNLSFVLEIFTSQVLGASSLTYRCKLALERSFSHSKCGGKVNKVIDWFNE